MVEISDFSDGEELPPRRPAGIDGVAKAHANKKEGARSGRMYDPGDVTSGVREASSEPHPPKKKKKKKKHTRIQEEGK